MWHGLHAYAAVLVELSGTECALVAILWSFSRPFRVGTMLWRVCLDRSHRVVVDTFFAAQISVAAEIEPLKSRQISRRLQLLVELAARAGNKNAARRAAFTVFYALHDASRLAALRAIGALCGVHDLLAICSLCDLRHLSPSI